MKKTALIIVGVLVLLVGVLLYRCKDHTSVNLAGDWRLTTQDDHEYRLHILQDGTLLTGNLLRTNGTEPVDEITGKIRPDGSFEFMRGRVNQDYEGTVKTGAGTPHLDGKFLGQYTWSADRASEAINAPPPPQAAPAPVTPGKSAGGGTGIKEDDETPKKKKLVGATFSDANCPKGWALDKRSAHNETEFLCVYKACSCEDKQAGKCEIDATGALDLIKAPKDYTCVVESDECTIWCEENDALL